MLLCDAHACTKNHIKAGDNKGYLKTRDFGSLRIH